MIIHMDVGKVSVLDELLQRVVFVTGQMNRQFFVT